MMGWNVGGVRAIMVAITFLGLAKVSQAAGESDKTLYWYVNGEKQAFTFDENRVILQTSASAIDRTLWTQKTQDIVNIETYNGKTLIAMRAEDMLTNRPEGQLLVPVYQQGSDEPILLDDRIMVSFKDPYINKGKVLAFAEAHNLTWLNPDIANLPAGGVYTYVFQVQNHSVANNAAVVSARIYETETGLVASVQPNRVNHAKVNGDAVDNPNFVKSWHLQNTGQQLFCTSNAGSENADANVVGAWNAGFTGQGIRVAVIDVGGFEFNHPDMTGQFLPGWDCINNQPYDATNSYFIDPNQAHGMNVAGIIGAKSNDIGATGVAYDAKIIPLLISGSETSILIALQKALEMNVDVINMSFGTGYSEAVELQIENLVNLGRARYGTPYGTIIVASHGNDGRDDDVAPQWPSAYPEVISVTANTPDDKLKQSSDDWNVAGTWAANYGNKLDLSAPGVCVYTTDITGSNGYSTSDYGGLQKTSAASPIVAGVAALLLSKNNELTWQEVRETLLQTAEKTQPTSYNYNHDPSKPGHSREMGYGRINALGAVSGVAVGVEKPTLEATGQITMNTLVTDHAKITLHGDLATSNNMHVWVIDMTGHVLQKQQLTAETKVTQMDMSNLPAGMYLASFILGDAELLETKRFVKIE